MSEIAHYSVLRNEVLQYVTTPEDGVVVDCTLGGGGYAEAYASMLKEKGVFIGIDLDKAGVARAEQKLKGSLCTVHLVEANFRYLCHTLEALNIAGIDACVIDLGLSMYQLKEGGRGFSFREDEPLLMTFRETPTEYDTTAEEIVNEWSEEKLREILTLYADERFSKRIAGAIVRAREESRITRSGELAEIVKKAAPARFRKPGTHPATKTFQALRIAVNEEYEALKEVLECALEKLKEGGRIGVVTFHSGEDAIVKSIFREAAQKGTGVRILKKPLVPRPEEIEVNPASRSAKLRVFEKKKETGE